MRFFDKSVNDSSTTVYYSRFLCAPLTNLLLGIVLFLVSLGSHADSHLCCVQIPILAGFAVNLLGLYFDKNLDVAGSYDLTEGALSY